jgi:tetrahedral aminopeptidase
MDIFSHLKALTETASPSGYETAVAEVIRDAWQPLVDEISVDRLGSLVALKKGQGDAPRPRLLLAAHMDEIGMMVHDIVAHPDEEGFGFLRLTSLGGVDTRHLYGQLVTVHASRGEPRQLTGVVGALPNGMQPKARQGKPYSYEDLVVDVGLSFKQVKELIAVGDVISFRQPLRQLLNNRVSGKALDNRASVAAVTVCLDYLQKRRHDWDLLAVATVQEEVGLVGAFTSGHAQRPDAAVAIDVTFAKGPGTNDSVSFELDSGPTLGLGPNIHPGMLQALQDAAKSLEMKVNIDPQNRHSGTDAYALQIARAGVATAVVSIPLRYMHTMVETVVTSDIERVGRLLGEFVVQLEADFIEKLTAGMME